MATTTNALMVAFHDGIGEGITPTLDFAPQTGHPASNVGGSVLSDKVRSPATDTSVKLVWDLGSAREINVAMFASSNATAAAQQRLRLADDASISSGVAGDTGTVAAFDNTLGSLTEYVPPWGRKLIYVWPQSYSKRFVEWTVTDNSNPDAYVELGPARFGLGLQVSFNEWRKVPDFRGALGFQKPLRGHELVLHNLSRAEAYSLEQMLLGILNTRRVLVLPEPLAPDAYRHDAIWGVLEEVYVRDPLERQPYNDRRFRMVLRFREVDV